MLKKRCVYGHLATSEMFGDSFKERLAYVASV